MGRTPTIPVELRRRPFTLSEARAAGITRNHLTGKSWRRLATGIYCCAGCRLDPWQLICAWKRVLPNDAVFAGATAAWLSGLDTNPTEPIEVTMPPRRGLRSRHGLIVRHNTLDSADWAEVRGLRATTLNRTLCDLCAQLPPVEALCIIDMAVATGRADSASLIAYADTAPRRNGPSRLRQLAELAAPAESPMETRLRWLLLQARLPSPEVQKDLREEDGRFIGRADLYYPAARLVIEYDGANHRDRLVEDNRRQNALIDDGFTVLRFTASDLDRPEIVAGQVRRALSDPAPRARRLG